MAPLARLFLVALVLAPAFVRRLPAAPPRTCERAGRGEGARRWLGCATDPGPARDLAGDERLVLGLPLDVNRATARELSFVPGLSRSLAAAIVEERESAGPFVSPGDLLRIHGIGPKRLARAAPFLVAPPRRVAVARDGE